MTRLPLAALRCGLLLLLTAAGFAYSLLMLISVTLVVPFPAAVAGQQRLAALGRRLVRRWAGVDVPDVPRTPLPLPQRRADGWYLHGATLYRSPRTARWMSKFDHYGDDPLVAVEWRWLTLAPFTSAVPLLLPPALITFGLLALRAGPWGWLPAGVAITTALLIAPTSLRWFGQSTRYLLRERRHQPRRGRISRAWTAGWRLAGLAGLHLAAFGAALLTLVTVIPSWGGLLLMITTQTRPMTEIYRRQAHRWTGVSLPSPYRPLPTPPAPGEDGTYRVGRTLYTEPDIAAGLQRHRWVSHDPATWRDQLWAWGALLWAPLSLLPAILISAGFFGLVLQPLTWAPWAVPIGLFTGYWITPFYLWYALEYAGAVPTWIPGWTSLLLGLALTLLGLALAVPLTRARTWWDALLLSPTAATLLAAEVSHLNTTQSHLAIQVDELSASRSLLAGQVDELNSSHDVLAGRVEQLNSSRADTADAAAAELRRIERDLHDGAQARLVAVGLGLGAVARLLETDPVRARELLTQAQETSATALAELRDLVRGIHPPVLAERGLTDAVRAIALDTPLPVTVDTDLPGRLEPAVESAVYFAVCETLANAARVASTVTLTLRHQDGLLRMVVTDDGPGGADPSAGTGLLGIMRRLGAFDGTVTLHSPAGGPTVVIMEVPCALSSPKTSTS
ncbi:histidine kinase [Actinoplanes sp. NPDC026670]|uniref:sensor histidine kinase n=1 Tax=Actinoplanes sp. NPDC026670 TaxID=3154700 RepID=UPI0033C32105